LRDGFSCDNDGDVQQGARFGNYRSVGLLGEGGMGAVYLAEHPDIGRKVAVKVLRAELSRDAQLLTRFLNEARAANAIRHPNIIEILDSGTTDDGLPYLVMELLEGQTLAARLRRLGRLSIAETLDLGYQIASALGAAHRKGIVHRDLKPDNLFLIADDSNPGRERIKVLDFGIAKLQARATASDMVHTRTGTLMGTPTYMSPEQCRGNRELDARSDIYSLGIILFEMLAGRTPFMSTGFGELVDMHLNRPPPSLRSILPEVPAEIESLIVGMLAKRPEQRTGSMTDVQNALKRAANGRKVGVSTPDFGVRTLPLHQGPAVVPAPASPTTFTTGVGERFDQPGPARPGRTLWLAAILVVVASAAAWGTLHLLPPPGVSTRATEPTQASGSTPPPAGPQGAAAPGAAGGPLESAGARPPTAAGGPGESAAGLAGEPPSAAPAGGAAPTSPPALVQIKLTSRPSAARVVRVSDGVVLGRTPFSQAFPAGAAPLEVRLEKGGFQPATRLLRFDGDRDELVPLAPQRPGFPRRRNPPPDDAEEPAKL
jgi:serine/threonine protein kinase